MRHLIRWWSVGRVERGQDFDATAVKDLFQGSMDTQMTLLRMTDRICEDLK